MSLEAERIAAKFRPVFRELKSLERKIDKKDGWFFIEHKYTIDELLESEHHQKINSYTDKIGDDIEKWFNQGRLNEIEEEMYYLKRSEVEDELEDINSRIEEREPTLWEEVKGTMKSYVVIIMDNMPDELKKALLITLADSMKNLRNIFSSQKHLPKP